MDKPADLVGYTSWAKTVIGSDFDDPVVKRVYATNVENIKNSVTQHPFFKRFSAQAASWAESYLRETGSDLFMTFMEPTLITKPFTSAVEKSFRMNVLW